MALIPDLNGDYGSTRHETTVDEAMSRLIALKPDLVISTRDLLAGQRRSHLAYTGVQQTVRR